MRETFCPRCGRSLAADAPGGLCASCLLVAAAETMALGSIDTLPTMASGSPAAMPTMLSGSTDHMATMSSAVGSVVAVAAAPAVEPGTEWGPYRIGRLLGRGGMGEVYEADHLHSGRRVALKVLRNRLQSQDERARFLREGQLAASLSHPHTVYIFGSEEIDGTPVISMELLTGGTLKDRVTANGPMSVDDAVAAVMDLIGGLDAAAAAGILHRDIKPSNCFIDRDGVVKVGDFGLSISTLARDVHQQLLTSRFEGTPPFSPPEQLRGEPLDVRADIYAVGATLYYLLTGRPPFDAPDLQQLFTRVTKETAVPPRQIRRDIPPQLSAIVMQCLAKAPADRPSTYRMLAEALRPLLTRDDRPAALGTRMLASVLDSWIVVGVPMALVTTMLADPLSGSPSRTLSYTAWSWVVTFAYYVVLEGATGASLGKRLFGMRVVSADGSAVTWPQMIVRTAIFFVPDLLGALVLGASATGNTRVGLVRTAATLASSAVMFFATARRSNGWAGLHDVVSGIRVVARPAVAARHARTVQPPVAALTDDSAHRYGPFIALGGDGRGPGAVVRAFDPVLRRQVWIQVAASSAPAISDARRDLARPGRLHWLSGRRAPDENWDAYEAPDGAPWTTTSAADAWSLTKLQLLDVVDELSHASADGTQPPLALDRVWARDNGHVVLLDFAPPEAAARGADLTPERLLQAVASRVPRHPSEPERIPLSARALLEQWSGSSPPSVHDARVALQNMMAAPNRVQRWRRALPGALAAAPVALMLLVGLLMIPALARFGSSDTRNMMNLLGALRSTTLPADSSWRQPDVRTAAEVAIAGRYGDRIRSEEFWQAGVVRALAPNNRRLAEEILERHPTVSSDELSAAEAVLKKVREERRADPGPRPEQVVIALGGIIISTVTALAMAIVLIACLISSIVVPGGIVARQLGLATVTRAGTEITRGRSLLRTLVAGLPGIAWLTYLALAPRIQGFVPTPASPITAAVLTVTVLGGGVIWTIVKRTRGPHDLLTGTWVVPR